MKKRMYHILYSDDGSYSILKQSEEQHGYHTVIRQHLSYEETVAFIETLRNPTSAEDDIEPEPCALDDAA